MDMGYRQHFKKIITLRVFKILYSFSTYSAINKNPKRKIYKEMNRVIENEKGEFLLKVGIRLFLATDDRTLY
ncbi:hypothetical protein BK772_28790 [Bacillus thuringiensis serovar finitimus]|uniref:Uncharacterized protein n=1 Tax=Bacillus thuringiensis subsp. finitimus TaxID=29337 RepID=A0A243GBD7_BACTF|nr:hypothetical protein ATN06_04930 [Bacillus thuringiensis]OUA03892.1 hypothetical protein BK772_28790 [Bacillus thuringiensis serovar finitimus]